MKAKNLIISMTLLPIIITLAFSQGYSKSLIRVHKFSSNKQSGYSSWKKSPLNPLVHSKPYWSVNKWPPPKPVTAVQEEKEWAPPTNQKIVTSKDKEKKEKKKSRKFPKPHFEKIDEKFLKSSNKGSEQEYIENIITLIGTKSAVRILN